MKLSTFKAIAIILLSVPMPMYAQLGKVTTSEDKFGPLEEQEAEWEKEINSNRNIMPESYVSVSKVSSSDLRHKGTYTKSGQSLCVNTGEYTSDVGDFTFEAEFYDDYIMVGGVKCEYAHTKPDGRKVYGDDLLAGFGNATKWWIVDSNYNMSYETDMPSPGFGSLTFVNTVSKGETTMPKHNTGGGYTSGGYNNGSSSGGSRNTTNSGTTKSTPTRHTCPLCHGNKTIVRESGVPTYGMGDRRYCSTCGKTYWASSGHSHIPCTQCHGKGYFTTE